MVGVLRGGISWEKIKRWVNIRIRIKDSGNTFVGEDSGKVTTGYSNSFLGYRAGYSNLSGHTNNFMGSGAGYSNTTGYYNNFMGCNAGYSNTSGHRNSFIGFGAGYSNTTGYYNNFIGFESGYSNISGHHNISIGYNAGYYETENHKLFIDVFPRTNAVDARIKALIYGIFDSATANQLLRINGILQLTEIKNGATQAGAGAAANEVWKTNGHATLPDNVLMIGV